ncbi:MAG: DNA-directed RNA polymerase subunit B'' [Candidatus Nanohalarchaeota archaeon]|nr:MAG: DNA-directed RNA polymerase subunit B'' [Candidatus Nanohaloarchaeota archaeon]
MGKSGLLKKFLEQKTNYNELAKHQIDSYNYFVKYGMNKVLDEIGVQEINIAEDEQIKLKLSNIKIGTPVIKEVDGSKRILTPLEARTRDLNYMVPVYVDIVPYFGSRECIPKQTELYQLPVMVNSCICLMNNMSPEEKIKAGEDPYDPGGYFIINGTERVIVNFEHIASNKLILRKKDKDISVRIDSSHNGFTQKHSFEKTKKGLVVARFSMFSKEPVPIVILMKILGIEKDKDVVDAITAKDSEKEDIFLNLMQCDCPTKKECFSYVSEILNIKEEDEEREKAIIYQKLDTNLLAFIGTDENSRIQKAIYLAKIFRKLILLHNDKLPDEDIDHYSNKRIRTVGELLENLFRYSIIGKWGLISKLQFNYQRLLRRGKKIVRLEEMISQNTMTKQILRAMATGNWISGETGVCQRLERTNYMRAQEHARSIISPLTPSQEHFDARELHCTHWGRLCPVRTPEGQNIGLRKYLAVGGQITEEADKETAEYIYNKIKKLM